MDHQVTAEIQSLRDQLDALLAVMRRRELKSIGSNSDALELLLGGYERRMETFTFERDAARSRCERLLEKAHAVARLYRGTYQGEPMICNVVDGEPVNRRQVFDEFVALVSAMRDAEKAT